MNNIYQIALGLVTRNPRYQDILKMLEDYSITPKFQN